MTAPKPQRLVVMASALIDVVLDVPQLPPRGGDVLARPVADEPGGAFNIASAAARLGLPTWYAGPHGIGPRGDQLRAALGREGVTVATPPSADQDTGYCLTFVDGDGERTFVTVGGADTAMAADVLAAVEVGAADAVYVTGYDLAYPVSAAPLVGRINDLPATALLVVDPGPLIADIERDIWSRVARRIDLLSWSDREESLLPGLRTMLRQDAVVVRRAGADDVRLELPEREPLTVATHPVDPVDTNGAGDVHVAALLAALHGGLTWEDAVAMANLAAAYATTGRGGACGPTLTQLRTFEALT